MDSESNELRIFAEAIAINDADARHEYLTRACNGDLRLRNRLDRLILAHLNSVSVLDEFSLNSTNWEFNKDHTDFLGNGTVEPGTVIAHRYALIERIGRGGMGEVWVAQQSKPIKRKVAIKLIHAGMDSRQVLRRFNAERQALALMEHPNIATIYDGGTTTNGRPYFAMELVEGVMVTEYCDRCQLTVRERLVLFRQICEAVQHAHQKGLIHRDLKPSNILVTETGGIPSCKIIDFGLAKAVQGSQSLTEASLNTAFGAVLGTPMYMAPEQLRVSQQDVDTRADLYSLGVILYELLTGSTPIERDRVKKAAWDEVLRMIREEDPPAPSQRLSSSDSLPSVAASRHIEPVRLTNLVKGELDWIIMKALDKNRNRRYESASDFGLDIHRYLSGEVVHAAPPNRLYKARKFVSRNRGLVSFGMLLFLSLLVGIGGTSYGLYTAKLSAVAESLAKNDALNKQKDAEQQRNRAEAREQQAILAVNRFGDAVRNNPELKNNPQLGELRKTLLHEPIEFFQSLRSELEKEMSTQTQALEQLAQIAFDLGLLIQEVGNRNEALESFQQSLLIRAKMLEQDPSNIYLIHDVSASHAKIAVLQLKMGKHELAIEQNLMAADLLQKAIKEKPDDLKIRRDFAGLQSNMGNIHSEAGDTEKALHAYQRAIESSEQLAADNPLNDEYLLDSIGYRYNLAAVLAGLGKYENAISEANVCVQKAKHVLESTPDSVEHQTLLSITLGGMGFWIAESRSVEEAIPIYSQEIQVNQSLVKNDPSNNAHQRRLARSYFAISSAYDRLLQPSNATSFIDRSIGISEKIVRENPGVLDFQNLLAVAYEEKGKHFSRASDTENAIKQYQLAMKIRERIVELSPGAIQYQVHLACNYHAIAVQLTTINKPEAHQTFNKAIAIFEKLVQDHSDIVDNFRWLAACLLDLASFEIDEANLESSREHLIRAETHIKQAIKSSPSAKAYPPILKAIYSNMIRNNHPAFNSRAKKGLVEIVKSYPRSAKLESRIAQIIDPKADEPVSGLLEVAYYGYQTLRYELASRIYRLAMDKFPAIVQDLQSQVRYNAACCAALAADNRSYEESIDDTNKVQLRVQAIAWLREELAAWKNHLDSAPSRNQKQVVEVLEHWQNDSDLASLRDRVAIVKLTEKEQQTCDLLWQEVASLLKAALEPQSQESVKP